MAKSNYGRDVVISFGVALLVGAALRGSRGKKTVIVGGQPAHPPIKGATLDSCNRMVIEKHAFVHWLSLESRTWSAGSSLSTNLANSFRREFPQCSWPPGPDFIFDFGEYQLSWSQLIDGMQQAQK